MFCCRVRAAGLAADFATGFGAVFSAASVTATAEVSEAGFADVAQ